MSACHFWGHAVWYETLKMKSIHAWDRNFVGKNPKTKPKTKNPKNKTQKNPTNNKYKDMETGKKKLDIFEDKRGDQWGWNLV